jgi:hypothetical protein
LHFTEFYLVKLSFPKYATFIRVAGKLKVKATATTFANETHSCSGLSFNRIRMPPSEILVETPEGKDYLET